MLHPHTELRYVSPEIGYGIFAIQDSPLGTITWVRDQLDRTFSKDEIDRMSEANRENLLKYTYRDKNGDYFFCWDLTRYVNHSYVPNSMITPLGFELAIRDIKAGDEITNDYGTLNIIEPFQCALGPHEREFVRPDDLKRFHLVWDELINKAMKRESLVDQPLAKFLYPDQQSELSSIRDGHKQMPSLLSIFYDH